MLAGLRWPCAPPTRRISFWVNSRSTCLHNALVRNLQNKPGVLPVVLTVDPESAAARDADLPTDIELAVFVVFVMAHHYKWAVTLRIGTDHRHHFNDRIIGKHRWIGHISRRLGSRENQNERDQGDRE